MPDLFRIISEYFWAITLGFSVFNYWKAGRNIEITVERQNAPEAKTYLRRFAAVSALPWVVMGVGQITGSTPTVWHYFRPQDGEVFVLAWLATIFFLSCAFAWWVFLANGAKKFVEFNLVAVLGHHNPKPLSEKMVKFFAALGVIMFPVWIYATVSMNAPLPQ